MAVSVLASHPCGVRHTAELAAASKPSRQHPRVLPVLVGSCPPQLLSASCAWSKQSSLRFHSSTRRPPRRMLCRATAADADSEPAGSPSEPEERPGPRPVSPDKLTTEVAKAVKKTATTFAPRASTKSRNPAVPGSTLYTVFEVQAYLSMVLGGFLSYNLIFPSNEPDLWRLMGMWSVWMFTIPSLRARDCSDAEKTALNYLFLAIPIVNVTLPLVWKSFAAVWTADVITFLAFYSWKMEWLKRPEESVK